MKSFCTFGALLIAAALVTMARGGHEVPIYPSFYPHEIAIRALAREQAADALLKADIHAYIGPPPRFAGPLPESIRTVESLGSFVVVRVNPDSPLAKDEPSACGVANSVIRALNSKPGDFIFHSYPVTPFHGDYLHHVDLAEAAMARFSDAAGDLSPAVGELKIKASGRLVQNHPDWSARNGCRRPPLFHHASGCRPISERAFSMPSLPITSMTFALRCMPAPIREKAEARS